MSESKHTPGPWKWSDAHSATDERYTWSLLGASGYGILSCDGEGNSPQGLGDFANARLIAAAPELLEALKQVTRLFGREIPFDRDHYPTIREAVDCARAAIAKAVGGAQ